jgi:hypothetical protein
MSTKGRISSWYQSRQTRPRRCQRTGAHRADPAQTHIGKGPRRDRLHGQRGLQENLRGCRKGRACPRELIPGPQQPARRRIFAAADRTPARHRRGQGGFNQGRIARQQFRDCPRSIVNFYPRPRRHRARQPAIGESQHRGEGRLCDRPQRRPAAYASDFPMTETTLPTAVPTRQAAHTIDHDVALAE